MEATRLKILAIDDQPDNLTTLKAVVQDALPKCTLLTALTGQQGIELAKREDPDVILLDIVMPEMDGVDLYLALKRNKATATLPVIISTDKQMFLESFSALGVRHFIQIGRANV